MKMIKTKDFAYCVKDLNLKDVITVQGIDRSNN